MDILPVDPISFGDSFTDAVSNIAGPVANAAIVAMGATALTKGYASTSKTSTPSTLAIK
tara:strand:- start:1198 stop:1374 length:177 start_codon:yes stop_codon:yes gene_type:complete